MKLSLESKLKPFNYFLMKIILALLFIQIIRAVIMGLLWYTVKPGNNIVLFQALNGISFIIVGLILLWWFKPSLKDLSMDWWDINFKKRIFYGLSGIVLLVLIILPLFLGFEQDIIVMGLVFGFIVPAFEELLFRGYIWNKIENFNEDNPNKFFKSINGLLTLITVTLLFALWHVGYVDVFIINPMIKQGNISLTTMLMAKVGLGLFLGTILGIIRLKTGKVYASFLFHGFWNVFAP